jgi:hypothetical protein
MDSEVYIQICRIFTFHHCQNFFIKSEKKRSLQAFFDVILWLSRCVVLRSRLRAANHGARGENQTTWQSNFTRFRVAPFAAACQ